MSNYKLKGGVNNDGASILTLPDPVMNESGPCKEDQFIRRFGFRIVLREKSGGVLWERGQHLYTQDEALSLSHREYRQVGQGTKSKTDVKVD